MAIRVLNISPYVSYPSFRIGILDLRYRYLPTYRSILSNIDRNIVVSPIPIPIPIPISRFRTPLRLGGLKKVENSLEIDSIARFAVEEHNKKENAHLKFEKVVNTKHQVVCGSLYYITLEATDSGQKKVCVAKVWVKPWLNFKELQEFKAY